MRATITLLLTILLLQSCSRAGYEQASEEWNGDIPENAVTIDFMQIDWKLYSSFSTTAGNEIDKVTLFFIRNDVEWQAFWSQNNAVNNTNRSSTGFNFDGKMIMVVHEPSG